MNLRVIGCDTCGRRALDLDDLDDPMCGDCRVLGPNGKPLADDPISVVRTDRVRGVSAIQVGYYGRCDRCGERADHSSRGSVEEALSDAEDCPCRWENPA